VKVQLVGEGFHAAASRDAAELLHLSHFGAKHVVVQSRRAKPIMCTARLALLAQCVERRQDFAMVRSPVAPKMMMVNGEWLANRSYSSSWNDVELW
jgi:hypothetical protein